MKYRKPRPQPPAQSNISTFRETSLPGQSGAAWLKERAR